MSLVKHHAKLEKNVVLLLVGIFLTVIVGGLVEIFPLFTIKTTIEKVDGVRPYSPLELMGRDVYVAEGCYLCHSQMIRPFRDEWERYGHYSLAAESMYDHPFQWGSKRTGPDLARVGGKYSNAWHVAHMIDPRSVVPESIMPGYPHLAKQGLRFDDPEAHLKALNIVGTKDHDGNPPYSNDQLSQASADLAFQANAPQGSPSVCPAKGEEPEGGALTGEVKAFCDRYPKAALGDFDGDPEKVTKLDAMVAYLQMLGTLVDFNTYEEDLTGR